MTSRTPSKKCRSHRPGASNSTGYSMIDAVDLEFMARALKLAELGLYTTTPNPRVGCVIVRDGMVVGEGWHEHAGGAHAEIGALKSAGERAHGATAFVSLEPCHHHGRTPPCDQALVAAGVKRVVAAMLDPDPRTAGQGVAYLRERGTEVDCGAMEGEAVDLNKGFISRVTRGRPWARLKVAASLDGKTALVNGKSQWITQQEARDDAHHWRARSCAVLTGIGTVLDDNPLLTVRAVTTPRQPLRVVVDSRLEIPLNAKILEGGGVVIACATVDERKSARLQELGAEIITLPDASKAGAKVDLPGLIQALGARGINELHIEAGHKLNGSLLKEGCVDEVLLYVAPCLLGDRAHGIAELPELTDLGKRVSLKFDDVRRMGSDIRVLARIESR